MPRELTVNEEISSMSPKLISAKSTHPIIYIRLFVASLTSAPLDDSTIYIIPL